MIEWRANAPKWVQVADVLKARIADGTYPPDTQLPSQHQLVEEFGIAPNTAQKVLTRLRQERARIQFAVWALSSGAMRPRRTTDQLTRLLTRSSESQTVQAHSETRGRLGYSGPLPKSGKPPYA